MSASLSGIGTSASGKNASDKNKPKFQTVNINNLYKGKSLEQAQQKTIKPCGLQILGKVSAVRRVPPPANLPSAKSENSGQDPNIKLVPSGSGWGSGSEKDLSEKSGSIPHSDSSARPNHLASSTLDHHPNNKASAPFAVGHGAGGGDPSHHQQEPTTKSWTQTQQVSNGPGGGSAGDAGPTRFSSALAAHKEAQSSYLNQEFPSLATESEKEKKDGKQGGVTSAVYGPGPALRPQSEGSWTRGTAGNVQQQQQQQQNNSQQSNSSSSGPGLNGGSLADKPFGSHANQQQSHGGMGQFQPPPFQFPVGFPLGRGQVFHISPDMIPPPRPSYSVHGQRSSRYVPDDPSRPRMEAQIISDKDLKTFDDISAMKDDWSTVRKEIDYNAKLDFDEDDKTDEISDQAEIKPVHAPQMSGPRKIILAPNKERDNYRGQYDSRERSDRRGPPHQGDERPRGHPRPKEGLLEHPETGGRSQQQPEAPKTILRRKPGPHAEDESQNRNNEQGKFSGPGRFDQRINNRSSAADEDGSWRRGPRESNGPQEGGSSSSGGGRSENIRKISQKSNMPPNLDHNRGGGEKSDDSLPPEERMGRMNIRDAKSSNKNLPPRLARQQNEQAKDDKQQHQPQQQQPRKIVILKDGSSKPKVEIKHSDGGGDGDVSDVKSRSAVESHSGSHSGESRHSASGNKDNRKIILNRELREREEREQQRGARPSPPTLSSGSQDKYRDQQQQQRPRDSDRLSSKSQSQQSHSQNDRVTSYGRRPSREEPKNADEVRQAAPEKPKPQHQPEKLITKPQQDGNNKVESPKQQEIDKIEKVEEQIFECKQKATSDNVFVSESERSVDRKDSLLGPGGAPIMSRPPFSANPIHTSTVASDPFKSVIVSQPVPAPIVRPGPVLVDSRPTVYGPPPIKDPFAKSAIPVSSAPSVSSSIDARSPPLSSSSSIQSPAVLSDQSSMLTKPPQQQIQSRTSPSPQQQTPMSAPQPTQKEVIVSAPNPTLAVGHKPQMFAEQHPNQQQQQQQRRMGPSEAELHEMRVRESFLRQHQMSDGLLAKPTQPPQQQQQPQHSPFSDPRDIPNDGRQQHHPQPIQPPYAALDARRIEGRKLAPSPGTPVTPHTLNGGMVGAPTPPIGSGWNAFANHPLSSEAELRIQANAMNWTSNRAPQQQTTASVLQQQQEQERRAVGMTGWPIHNPNQMAAMEMDRRLSTTNTWTNNIVSAAIPHSAVMEERRLAAMAGWGAPSGQPTMGMYEERARQLAQGWPGTTPPHHPGSWPAQAVTQPGPHMIQALQHAIAMGQGRPQDAIVRPPPGHGAPGQQLHVSGQALHGGHDPRQVQMNAIRRSQEASWQGLSNSFNNAS